MVPHRQEVSGRARRAGRAAGQQDGRQASRLGGLQQGSHDAAWAVPHTLCTLTFAQRHGLHQAPGHLQLLLAGGPAGRSGY